MDGSDFECDNEFNVIVFLQCDGYNNCGDFTVEINCPPQSGGSESGVPEAWRYATFGLAGFIVIILFAFLCFKLCKRNKVSVQNKTI